MARRESAWEKRQESRAAAAEKRLLSLMATLQQPAPAPRAPAPGPVPVPVTTPVVNIPAAVPHLVDPDPDEEPPEPIDTEDEGELPDDDLIPDIDKEAPRFVPMPSPPDDPAQFIDLISRAAAKFKIPLPQEEGPSSFLMDKLSPPMKVVTHIPIDPVLWMKGKELLKTPASVAAVAPRHERKYQAPLTDPMCLRGPVPPDSVIVSTAQRKGPTTSAISPQALPHDKDQRRLDGVGKKVCATASLAVRAANTTAVLARYDRELWDSWEDLIPLLPEDKRQVADNLLKEGRVCANHTLKAAMDSTDIGFRSLAHGVSLRRHAWLADSGFPQEVRRKVLDLPFTGETLFGAPVDEAMKGIKEDLEQVKAMNVLHPKQQRTFRGRNARGKGGTSTSFPDRTWQTQASDRGGRYTPYPQGRGGRGRGSRGNGPRAGRPYAAK